MSGSSKAVNSCITLNDGHKMPYVELGCWQVSEASEPNQVSSM